MREGISRSFRSIQVWFTCRLTILSLSLHHRGQDSQLRAQSISVRRLRLAQHSVHGDGGLAQDLHGLRTRSSSIGVRGLECGPAGLDTFILTCTQGWSRWDREWRFTTCTGDMLMMLPIFAGRKPNPASEQTILAQSTWHLVMELSNDHLINPSKGHESCGCGYGGAPRSHSHQRGVRTRTAV
jgi:hypothetical protein